VQGPKEVSMRQMFVLGGAGMWPTLVFGLLMIGVAIRYAMRPERRFVPLLVGLGMMTSAAGLLGFVSGVAKSLLAMSTVPPDRHWLSLLGLGESLMNLVLALLLVFLASAAATIGAWRLARAMPPQAAPAPGSA